MILELISKPLRKKWSNDYISKGDIYLEQKKYLTAEIQYDKALTLYSGNEAAKNRKELATNAEKDILALADFYKEKNISSQIELFQSATAVPASKVEAVKNAKTLLEKDEYQLAKISAKTATEMDKSYRDAWIYLGIANLKAYENLEVSKDSKSSYKDEAKASLETAKLIDPTYELIQSFLKKIEN